MKRVARVWCCVWIKGLIRPNGWFGGKTSETEWNGKRIVARCWRVVTYLEKYFNSVSQIKPFGALFKMERFVKDFVEDVKNLFWFYFLFYTFFKYYTATTTPLTSRYTTVEICDDSRSRSAAKEPRKNNRYRGKVNDKLWDFRVDFERWEYGYNNPIFRKEHMKHINCLFLLFNVTEREDNKNKKQF